MRRLFALAAAGFLLLPALLAAGPACMPADCPAMAPRAHDCCPKPPASISADCCVKDAPTAPQPSTSGPERPAPVTAPAVAAPFAPPPALLSFIAAITAPPPLSPHGERHTILRR